MVIYSVCVSDEGADYWPVGLKGEKPGDCQHEGTNNFQ